jgi:uncharacterized protein (TIGR02996 family)
MAKERDELWSAICKNPADETLRLVFADWLEENGDPHWAKYIRARCALDDKPPDPETYSTLFEQFLEGHAATWNRDEPKLPTGFLLSRNYSNQDEWWGDQKDGMQGGVPSLAAIDTQQISGDEAAIAVGVARRLPQLIEQTPVRGLDLGDHACGHLKTVLATPAARHLRRLEFESRPPEGKRCPDVAALVKSELVRSLTRLELRGQRGADIRALAAAPFEQLQHLVAYQSFHGPTPAIERLTSAPWFRRLQRLLIGLSPDQADAVGAALVGMPNLHTLALWHPDESAIQALGRSPKFPALRRLFMIGVRLAGPCGTVLRRLRTPGLVELWLRGSAAEDEDVAKLIASPLFDDLRVLTFDSTHLGVAGLNALATSPCAAKLRILRIKYAGVRSLSETPLTRAGAFPALTTLTIDSPGGKGGNRGPFEGTVELLAKLAAPNLRHLTLENCEFDDKCAKAVATNPSFAGLTRLVIYEGTMGAQGAEQLFRSPNLRNLIELKIHFCPIGKAAGVLVDQSVMPELVECWLDNSGVPDSVTKKLQRKRPFISLS